MWLKILAPRLLVRDVGGMGALEDAAHACHASCLSASRLIAAQAWRLRTHFCRDRGAAREIVCRGGVPRRALRIAGEAGEKRERGETGVEGTDEE